MNVVIDGVTYEIPRDVESQGRDAIAAYIASLVASLAPVTVEETDE